MESGYSLRAFVEIEGASRTVVEVHNSTKIKVRQVSLIKGIYLWNYIYDQVYG